MMNNIGNKIKELRSRKSLTMKDVAEALGVSVNTVYRWENGLVKPRLTIIGKIAEYFHITVEYLTSDEKLIFEETSDEFNGSSENYRNIDEFLLQCLRDMSETERHQLLGYMAMMRYNDKYGGEKK
jgi:transcriptional regulator with XRE-family HTH domain